MYLIIKLQTFSEHLYYNLNDFYGLMSLPITVY